MTMQIDSEQQQTSTDQIHLIDQMNEQAWRERATNEDRSRELASEAIKLSEQIGYSRGIVRGGITLAYREMDDEHYNESKGRLEQLIQLARDIGDRLGEARSLFVLGVDYRFLGEFEQGFAHYKDSLAIGEELADSELQAVVYNGMGNIMRSLGKNQEGRDYFERSARMAIEAGLDDSAARALYGVAVAYMEGGDHEMALRFLDESDSVARRAGLLSLLPMIMNVRATIYAGSGGVAKALQYELECLKLMEELNDQKGVSNTLSAIGDHYVDLGEYDCALDAMLRCLDISRRCGYWETEAYVLTRIGRLFETIDDDVSVVEYYLRGYRLAKDAASDRYESIALFYLGRYYRNHGDAPKALAYHLKCLRIEERHGYRQLQCDALMAVGNCYSDLQDYDKAREYLQSGYDIACSVHQHSTRIRALYSLGLLENKLGQRHPAVQYLEQALELARELEHHELSLNLLRELATITEDDPSARRRYEQEYSDLSQKIFNSESTRRVRSLIERFEGDLAIREGELLGLDCNDLESIRAAVATWKGLPQQHGIRERTASPSVAGIGDNTRQAGADARICITTLGAFRVVVDGQEVVKGAWKRKRARDLFKLLLANHRSAVTLDEIHDKLWGEIGERNLGMLVMNAATHIRNALGMRAEGAGSNASLIHMDRGFVLDLGYDSWIDFVRFKELIVAARRSETLHERIGNYAAAVELYGGDFLPEDAFVEWTDFQRQMLKDAWFEAMEFLAREHMRSGALDMAIERAREILLLDNTSETAYDVLLTSLKERGRLAEARKMFEQCVECYRQQFDAEPPVRLRAIVE